MNSIDMKLTMEDTQNPCKIIAAKHWWTDGCDWRTSSLSGACVLTGHPSLPCGCWSCLFQTFCVWHRLWEVNKNSLYFIFILYLYLFYLMFIYLYLCHIFIWFVCYIFMYNIFISYILLFHSSKVFDPSIIMSSVEKKKMSTISKRLSSEAYTNLHTAHKWIHSISVV